MASEAEAFFERLTMDFVPFIVGLAAAATATNPENPEHPDQENPDRRNLRERIILIHPFTQTMVVIEGDSGLDSLLPEMGNKEGQPPASKASVDAMPCVKIVEGVDGESECVICLEQFEIDGVAKEMPCKHRFHGDCIEKWLKIHGSCPVCRFKMPVEEEASGKKSDDTGREIRVSFYVNESRRTTEDMDPTPSAHSNASDSDEDIQS